MCACTDCSPTSFGLFVQRIVIDQADQCSGRLQITTYIILWKGRDYHQGINDAG